METGVGRAAADRPLRHLRVGGPLKRRSTSFVVVSVPLVVLIVALGLILSRHEGGAAEGTPRSIDYELTAECLAEHQAWNNFNETLAQLERGLRFCIEVWPSAAQP